MKFDLRGRLAQGLDFPDGAKYQAHEGYIEVDNPAHVAKLLTFTDLQVGQNYHFGGSDEAVCAQCGFVQFAAFRGRACPRCGETLG